MSLDTLLGLLACYSPSGQEQAAAEWLVDRMRALGYEQAFVDPAGNAVGVLGRGPRQVVLLGHIDTVPGEIPLRVEGGEIHARGAVDAKGPLACFVDAAARVGRVEGWQLVVIGAVDEERHSAGARYAAGQYRPDFAVIGEPNRWDRIALGYKGAAWAEVTARRAQAHSAAGRQTASEAAVDAWRRIEELAGRFNDGRARAFDQLLPALRGMQSGEDGFEQWARLTVAARLPLDVPPGQWYAWLAEAAPGLEVSPVGFPLPAWAGEKNTPLVRAFLQGIRSQGGTPAFVYKTGTADLNVVAPAWGCPALVYGPGDSSLDHTPEERIAVEEYHAAVRVLAASLRALIGQAQGRGGSMS